MILVASNNDTTTLVQDTYSIFPSTSWEAPNTLDFLTHSNGIVRQTNRKQPHLEIWPWSQSLGICSSSTDTTSPFMEF